MCNVITYICMYVHMYVCMYVYMYICILTFVYSIDLHTYVSTQNVVSSTTADFTITKLLMDDGILLTLYLLVSYVAYIFCIINTHVVMYVQLRMYLYN